MISVAKHFFNPTSSSKLGQYSFFVASLVSPLLYISNKKCIFIRLGSYRCESTPSRPIWQVKHSWARLVLGWETSWESRVLQAFFDFFTFLKFLQYFIPFYINIFLSNFFILAFFFHLMTKILACLYDSNLLCSQ